MQTVPELLALLQSNDVTTVRHAATLAEAMGLPTVQRVRALLPDSHPFAHAALTILEAKLCDRRALRGISSEKHYLELLTDLYPNLEGLDLSENIDFEDTDQLVGLKLRVLDLSNCFSEPLDEYERFDEHGERSGIHDVTPLGAIPTLRVLSLRGCKRLKAASLSALTQLEDLDVTHTAAESLEPLHTLRQLRRLRADAPSGVVPLALRALASLEDLTILGVEDVQSLFPLIAELPSLRRLDLGAPTSPRRRNTRRDDPSEYDNDQPRTFYGRRPPREVEPPRIYEGIALLELRDQARAQRSSMQGLAVDDTSKAALTRFHDAVTLGDRDGAIAAIEALDQLGDAMAIESIAALRNEKIRDLRLQGLLAWLGVKHAGDRTLDLASDVDPSDLPRFHGFELHHLRLGDAEGWRSTVPDTFDDLVKFSTLQTLTVARYRKAWRDYAPLRHLAELRQLDLRNADDVGPRWRQNLEGAELASFLELYADSTARNALGLAPLPTPRTEPGGPDDLQQDRSNDAEPQVYDDIPF